VTTTGQDPTTTETSESEEMYLITIAMLVEDGHDGPVPVPQLATELDVSRVAANEMVKKLDTRGLIEYTPYKGASLSEEGRSIARAVLRRRRLWSVFLSDRLGLSPDAADAVACEMEHITPAEVAHRLSDFLGEPQFGAQGRPIPSPEGPIGVGTISLIDLAVGTHATIVGLEGDGDVESFLHSQGISSDSAIVVVAKSDGAVLVEAASGRVHLSDVIAGAVKVTV
jgi:DtxR family Mn-dependent transcriptional regulator